ncbi:MAG: peptidase [Hyphomicrobiales bacterium]|nr:peptidase [Hyphomicrobiales bacterium]
MTTGFDRRRTPAREDLAAAHLEGAVAAPRYVEGRRMRVIDEVIPLRAQPTPDCSLDTQLLFGEEVVIYDLEEGWAWGQAQTDSYVGYMPADSLVAPTGAPTHKVSAPRTFLYPAANMKMPNLGALLMGAQVETRTTRGDFVQLANGLFVFAAHLSEMDVRQPDFVAVAEMFAGAPYLWGGKTFLGLDCSGLVQISLQAAGVGAPRDTDMQQAELGEALALDAPLQRGDLVFWKGHVAIMQDAQRMLHASGHHMQVVAEDFAQARQRIREKSFGDVMAIRRVSL